MSANTVLFDFSIEPARILEEQSRKDILKEIISNLKNYFPSVKLIYELTTEDGFLTILEQGNVLLHIRFFNDGLITINIEYYRKKDQKEKINFEVSSKFKQKKN